MTILHIDHRVPDYTEWKKLFDSDPADRAGSGVKSHRISKQSDDENRVLIELTFDDREKAEALLEKLLVVWSNMPEDVKINPQTRIVEILEEKSY